MRELAKPAVGVAVMIGGFAAGVNMLTQTMDPGAAQAAITGMDAARFAMMSFGGVALGIYAGAPAKWPADIAAYTRQSNRHLREAMARESVLAPQNASGAPGGAGVLDDLAERARKGAPGGLGPRRDQDSPSIPEA